MGKLLVGGLGLLLGRGELLNTSIRGERSSRHTSGKSEIDETDKEDHLEPSKGWDGLDGGNAVGDGGEGDSWGDLSWELEDLRNDVTKDG